jgi:molybdopterin synthase catalytic subunit
MSVTVHLFAALREVHGQAQLRIELRPGETLGALFDRLFPSRPDRDWPAPVMFAVDRDYVEPDHPLSDGDEVAFIPPLGGGTDDPRVALSHAPLSPRDVEERVAGPSRGAIVTFTGTVRDSFEDKRVVSLEYEAYGPMALLELAKVCDAVETRWSGASAAIVHRLGRLTIGEAAVILAVAAPHRAAAFEACAWAMTALKRTVPIFKKEVYADGSVWKGRGAG